MAIRSEPYLRSGLRWIPAVMPAVCAAIFAGNLQGWIWMWILALALFFGAKWMSISPMLLRGRVVHWGRLFAYLLLWPGMDARAFFGRSLVPIPLVCEWTIATSKMLLGATILWLGVPLVGVGHPLVTAWVGMVGMVFLLHFGFLHLLSLFWRALGINARPIMQSPGAATPLPQFGGGSWNAAFTDLMHEHWFKPLARHAGGHVALFTVFLVSGALHEFVISLPAHGGYGLPTIYFVIPGMGLLFERTRLGSRLGLGSGWKGLCFVALVAGLPAFWLFHPPFIHNVILPMLHAIGAT